MPPPELQSSPQENLSVVLGRFHAWDARQKGVPPSLPGEGIRELSYEEALAASRPRRPIPSQTAYAPVSNSSTVAPVAEAATIAAKPPFGNNPVETQGLAAPRKKRGIKAAMKLAAKSGAALRGKSTNHLKSGATKPVDRKVINSAASQVGSLRPVSARVKTKASASATEKSVADRKAKSATKAKRGTPTAPEAVRAISPGGKKKSSKVAPRADRDQSAMFRSALAACLKEAPRQSSTDASAQNKRSRKPSTQEATSETMQAHDGGDAKILMDGRQSQGGSAPKSVQPKTRTISVNLRLSQDEHARMSRAAMEAGLSMAAYIRESTMLFPPSRPREKQARPSQKRPVRSASTQKPDSFDLYERSILETGEPGILSRIKSFWLKRRLTAIA